MGYVFLTNQKFFAGKENQIISYLCMKTYVFFTPSPYIFYLNIKSSHLKIRVLLLSYWSLLQLEIGFFVDLCQIMVFNATFNNISVISWQTLLLVEETGVPGENHRSVAILSHNVAIHEQGSNSQL